MSRAKPLSKPCAQTRQRRNSKSAVRSTGPSGAAKKRNTVLCVLLAAATIALYSPVIGHSFIVLDDRDVTANPHIHEGLGWSTVKWAFTSTAAANWHPLTWLSHALDYQLFALNPAGHHLDSVLIHALNAVCCFCCWCGSQSGWGRACWWRRCLRLHPINVESVAWVAERKNVLSTFFFFLAIGAYVWYAQKPDWRRYLLVAALFAAGLMAKPMVITLPFVLLLLDYWPLGRTAWQSASDGQRAAVDVREAAAGENSAALSLGRERMDHPEGAAIGHAVRTFNSSRSRYESKMPSWPRAVSVEDALASAACRSIPIPQLLSRRGNGFCPRWS